MPIQSAEEVVGFYQTHPISEQQIMGKLKTRGIDMSALSEDILQEHDQDHYGGTAANDALAELAGISENTHVLDLCCGLGGPARYLANKFGCKVTGVDLTESRIEGATRLTKLTALDHLVKFHVGNALDLPFEDGSFDAILSQEGFCHIPQKPLLLKECARLLKRGGRLAFTDVTATDTTSQSARDRLQSEMAFHELPSIDQYIELIEAAGFDVAKSEDLGRSWSAILRDRLAMYRSLEDQTTERFGREHFEKWDERYAFFVGQYQTGDLGGVRILAVKQ